MGQTCRSLKECYSEHIYVLNNNPHSAYAIHTLQHAHEFGPIPNTMTLIHKANKGHLMDILEQLFMQKYYHKHKLIQEQIPGENNPLFTLLYDVILLPELAFDSALMLQFCSCHII
jgi:hypothetical protein